MRTILLITACLTAISGFADDTVLMKNGDILTGDILKETDEYLYLRSKAFGAVSLQTKDISEVRIQTGQDGKIATLPYTTAPDEKVYTLPPQADTPMPAPQFKPEEEAASQWSGQAGMSVAMRESTKFNATGVTGDDQIETYRLYGNVNWDADLNKLRWDWTYRYSRDEYAKQDDFLNLTQQYTHDFHASYYATAKTMYQSDYRRKIEQEYLQTAEMGVKWISLSDFELTTSVGGGYHRYDRLLYDPGTSMDQGVTRSQPKFILDESLRWQIISSLTLIQKYTHLGDLTNYHFVFTTGLENKLIRDIFLRLEYRLDRDTEVYYDDRGYYDKALLTSLLYKF